MHADTVRAAGALRDLPPRLIALACLLFVEGAALGAAAGWLLIELLTEQPASYLSAVALFILTLLAAAWMLFTAVNTLRAKPWIRAAALTWQVLQAAVAFASFQGLEFVPGIGWVLLAASILGIVFLVSPSVIAATTRHP